MGRVMFAGLLPPQGAHDEAHLSRFRWRETVCLGGAGLAAQGHRVQGPGDAEGDDLR